MTSLQYHCILGLAEIKTLHLKDAGCAGKKITVFREAVLQIRVCTGKLFSYFSTKTYVVGAQKNRLNEIEHPKHMFKLMGKEIDAIYGAIWTY